MNRGAECAAGFAVARIQVNPARIKGVSDEFRHFRGELAQLCHQLFFGFFHGVGAARLADGRKQIIEGESVLVAKQPALHSQIPAEVRQVFTDCAPHRVEGLLIHTAFLQGHVQYGAVAFHLSQGAGFQLDGAQAEAHGQLNCAVGGNLGFVGFLPGCRIGVVCLAAHRGQRQSFAAEIDLVCGIQFVAQLTEGKSSGKGHLQQPGLKIGRDCMVGLFCHEAQRKAPAVWEMPK